MKILLTEGCVVGSLLIDDVPADELQVNKLKNIVFTIINNIISNKANLIEMIDYLMTDTDISTSSAEYDMEYDERPYTEYMINSQRFGVILLKESFFEDASLTLTIDGKDVSEMSEDDIREVIKNIIEENVIESTSLIRILTALTESFGRYKFCYHCDECGDNVFEYELEV